MTDVLAAFFAAALAGTGVGGGGLLMIYLSLTKDLSQLAMQGINLLFFEATAAGALPVHLKKRRVKFGAALIVGAAGVGGAFAGARIAEAIDPSTLRVIFGYFLIFTGVCALFKKRRRNM
ncbi:MAG: TSUP family transporter [Clostridia bacterium]|nr:TSUP family transporter [Clostridia bacterium]